MGLLRDFGFGIHLGPFPLVAWAGFVFYTLIPAATTLALGKRWSKRIRRLSVKVHRNLGLLAVLMATIHLLMAISAYV